MKSGITFFSVALVAAIVVLGIGCMKDVPKSTSFVPVPSGAASEDDASDGVDASASAGGIEVNCDITGVLPEYEQDYVAACYAVVGVGSVEGSLAIDCDESHPHIAPDFLELWFGCDGIDNDCDGDIDEGIDCTIECTEPCDDGNPCTDDSCDTTVGECVSTPNTAPCDDEDLCTDADTCADGECQSGEPVDCNDDDACTDELCHPDEGCIYSNVDCDDGIDCTIDSCDASDGCVNTADDTECDDGNLCTDNVCDAEAGCESTPNTDPCDDGNECTDSDVCADGACLPGSAVDCTDDNVCTLDACNPDTGCVYLDAPDGAACDDDDACTLNECAGGECVMAPEQLDCSDSSACTADSCDSETGCVNTPIDGCCEADADCPEGDACTDNTCGPPLCYNASLNPGAACALYAPSEADGYFLDVVLGTTEWYWHSDEEYSTYGCTPSVGAASECGFCPDYDGDGACAPPCVQTDDCASTTWCNNLDVCQPFFCVETTQCPDSLICDAALGWCVVDEPEPECVVDADCTGGAPCFVMVCDAGACMSEPLVCDDGDACNPGTGLCELIVECVVDADCDDGDSLTADVCQDGLCVYACIPQCVDKECGSDGCGGSCGACTDGDTCVLGLCEPIEAGCVSNADCPDGELCLGDGSCWAGQGVCGPIKISVTGTGSLIWWPAFGPATPQSGAYASGVYNNGTYAECSVEAFGYAECLCQTAASPSWTPCIPLKPELGDKSPIGCDHSK